MQIMIDCYGHPASSERYQRDNFKKKAFLVDKADDDVTYVCFDASELRAIHRITIDGDVTEVRWAFGRWEDRENLDYSKTLNEPIMVDDADLD